VPINKERNKILVKANTNALKRLRREFHKEFRAFYLEELAKAGVTLQGGAGDETVAKLQAEVERLQALLADKGGK
jgi:uncharacterized small protein (DUF1192 family)